MLWIAMLGGLLVMMGQQNRSEALFYYFRLEDQVPENHLLRRVATVESLSERELSPVNLLGSSERHIRDDAASFDLTCSREFADSIALRRVNEQELGPASNTSPDV